MDTDINLAHQSGAAVLTVFALDYLKNSSWFPWITKETERLNQIVGILVALLTTVGFSIVSHSGDIHTGGQIVIAFPALSNLVNGLFHAATQYGMQEAGHKILGNHVVVKALLDKVTDLQGQVDKIQK